MARIFVADEREFPDPDPSLSVEEVRRSLADFLPELANAEVRETTRGEDTIYDFQRRVGTKG
jgi:PRTRC genetic system protein C